MLIRMIGVRSPLTLTNPQLLTSDPGAFETAPVLGHETYDEQPLKAPLPVRAESKYLPAASEPVGMTNV